MCLLIKVRICPQGLSLSKLTDEVPTEESKALPFKNVFSSSFYPLKKSVQSLLLRINVALKIKFLVSLLLREFTQLLLPPAQTVRNHMVK